MEEDFIISKIKKEETKNYGFNLLLKEYQERIYWHIRKMVVRHDDTDDLTQEVFIKVWNNLDKFRAESSLFTWIYRIATNECLNFLNKKKKRFFVKIHDVSEELSRELSVQNETIDGEEIEIKLQKALLKLPDKQRLVFNMKYFDGMKFDEIADITKTSVGALKASYHHAVKKVEESLISD